MRWLDRLPSVRLDRRCQLPDCPGIYFLVVGSSIYYVGKALNIRQRHSSESNHEIYSHLNRARPSLRELFHIKWIEFTDISMPGYPLDDLLLGYENYMIKTLYPPSILWTELWRDKAVRTHSVVGGIGLNQSWVKRQHGNKAFKEMLIERKSFVACD
jgi:hypothetical protein